MISLNRAQILGRLTRDPELRYTPSGKSVANFGVATNRRFKNAEGTVQDQTEFHDVVAWGKLAEISHQFLHKGEPVYIDGRLQTRSWDAPDGAKRQKTEIVAENVIALGARSASPTAGLDIEPSVVANDSEVPGEPKPAKEDVKPAKKSTSTKASADKEEKPADDINLDDLPF